MKLMTKELENTMPKYGGTEDTPIQEKIAWVKFFSPMSSWTWYGLEYDPKERIFSGYVDGHERELGDFSLEELESVRLPMGLRIERDIAFRPKTLGAIYPDLKP
jgi:hypothetical protein